MKRITILLITAVLMFTAAHSTIWAESQPTQATDSSGDMVVLIHGLGRSNSAMLPLASRLAGAGYQVERVGYDSLDQTPEEILEEISSQISDCCKDADRTVHYVGHSLGGLMVRAYLQRERPANLGRVVLLGTPNRGTALVDRFRDKWWMHLLGPTASALGTDTESFPASLDPPHYPVGVIAGISHRDNDHLLPGADDGLITVAATRLEGMADFIVLETGHSAMRYDKQVARQTIAFLRQGTFVHAPATFDRSYPQGSGRLGTQAAPGSQPDHPVYH